MATTNPKDPAPAPLLSSRRSDLDELLPEPGDHVPQAEASPVRPQWEEPDSWREARELSKAGQVDNAAEAQKILDMLSKM